MLGELWAIGTPILMYFVGGVGHVLEPNLTNSKVMFHLSGYPVGIKYGRHIR